MTKLERTGLLLASLGLAASASGAAAQGTGKVLDACTLLSGPEVRTVTKRSDVATGNPRSYQQTTDSYARMRDTYIEVPPSTGFRVEKQGGLGDDAYWLSGPPNTKVRLEMLVGSRRVSVAVSKATYTGQPVPEAE